MNGMPATNPESCAAKLRVLADSTRLEVMRLLSASPRVVKELLCELEIEQSLLSHHLRVLRDAGLVRSEIEGQSRRYFILSSTPDENTLDIGCCELTFKKASRRG